MHGLFCQISVNHPDQEEDNAQDKTCDCQSLAGKSLLRCLGNPHNAKYNSQNIRQIKHDGQELQGRQQSSCSPAAGRHNTGENTHDAQHQGCNGYPAGLLLLRLAVGCLAVGLLAIRLLMVILLTIGLAGLLTVPLLAIGRTGLLAIILLTVGLAGLLAVSLLAIG